MFFSTVLALGWSTSKHCKADLRCKWNAIMGPRDWELVLKWQEKADLWRMVRLDKIGCQSHVKDTAGVTRREVGAKQAWRKVA